VLLCYCESFRWTRESVSQTLDGKGYQGRGRLSKPYEIPLAFRSLIKPGVYEHIPFLLAQ
jgi:hypothetical protein